MNSCEELESALNLKHQPGGSQANQPGGFKEYIIQEKVNSQRTKYTDTVMIYLFWGGKKQDLLYVPSISILRLKKLEP